MEGNSRPLADRIRPEELDEVVGQRHLLAPGKLLYNLIEKGEIPNMIFYGPSGTGKTTVANIIANKTQRTLVRLNATTASSADIKEVIDRTGTILAPNGVLLYLDEIQYFNKKQQQLLLENIENGKITVIASTTENPYFYVYNAVLSRCTVFEFKPLTPEDIVPCVERGFKAMANEMSAKISCEGGVFEVLSAASGGDCRKALNSVEVLVRGARLSKDGSLKVSLEDAKLVTAHSGMRYDREGDEHFDCLSALMKSLRGSDPDAALHYLARLLEAGDMIGACRRLLCSASEDIGLAYPQAVSIVKACVDSAMQVGLPEARLHLAQAAILLATAPKSNSVVTAIDRAISDVRNGKWGPPPRELQNVHADSAGMEREQGYLYPHDFPDHWVKQQYMPDELKGTRYYKYGDNKSEQAAKSYWDKIKGRKDR